MGFGSSQNKDNIRGWFLQRLEKGVGGFFSEHVDFIYDIDLIAGLIGGVIYPLAEFSDFINTAITGSVNLNYIQSPGFSYCLAERASITWFAFTVAKAVDCLSQNTAGASLTGSPRAAEKIGMRHMTATEGVE